MAQTCLLTFRSFAYRLQERRFLSARPHRQLRVVALWTGDARARAWSTVYSAASSSSASGLDVPHPEYEPLYTDALSYSLVHAYPTLSNSAVEEMEATKPLPRNVESLTDDPQLHNPRARLERMGTGWFGVILDFEGAVIQTAMAYHIEAWVQLAEEESRQRPLQRDLIRAAPMKAEQAISEVLCWGREPHHVQRLARRKEEIFRQLTKEMVPQVADGLYRLLETLKMYNVPIAVCSTERERVFEIMKSFELWNYVDVVISAEDVGRCAPDPEAYAHAAQQLQRPPFRCVVIGASNHSCEGAHDCGMKYIATAENQRVYELNAADLVTKQLDDLSIVNLKELFRHEESTDPSTSSPTSSPVPLREEETMELA